MNTTNRRRFIRRGVTAAAAVTAAAIPTTAAAQPEKPVKKVHYRNGRKPEKPPLFNGTVSYGNLLFIAGVGYHSEGDIKVHTKAVLDQIQQQLESAGSSMEKVLKCNVYLNDLKDYAGRTRCSRAASAPSRPCGPPLRRRAAFPETRSSRSM
jgi:2-iminobutanoate/2-iminopropanoate deaminase